MARENCPSTRGHCALYSAAPSSSHTCWTKTSTVHLVWIKQVIIQQFWHDAPELCLHHEAEVVDKLFFMKWIQTLSNFRRNIAPKLHPCSTSVQWNFTITNVCIIAHRWEPFCHSPFLVFLSLSEADLIFLLSFMFFTLLRCFSQAISCNHRLAC